MSTVPLDLASVGTVARGHRGVVPRPDEQIVRSFWEGRSSSFSTAHLILPRFVRGAFTRSAAESSSQSLASDVISVVTQVETIGERSVALAVPRAIRDIESACNLSAGEVGRLLGVSRRSVHHWLAGERMTAAREERMRLLHSMFTSMKATPDAIRGALLSSVQGEPLLDQIGRGMKAPRIQVQLRRLVGEIPPTPARPAARPPSERFPRGPGAASVGQSA